MSIKLKALGLSLIAALAISGIAVLNASATTGGHVIASAHHITILGSNEAPDPFQFTGAATAECHHTTYDSTIVMDAGTTVTQFVVEPIYTDCTSTFGNATFHLNGCNYIFTVRSSPSTNDNTVHLVCPKGSLGVQITTPTCTLTVTPNQTPTGGVTYTNIAGGDITVGITVEGLHTTYSPAGSFGCAFQSTTTNAKMHGSAVMGAVDTNGNNVNIEAT